MGLFPCCVKVSAFSTLDYPKILGHCASYRDLGPKRSLENAFLLQALNQHQDGPQILRGRSIGIQTSTVPASKQHRSSKATFAHGCALKTPQPDVRLRGFLVRWSASRYPGLTEHILAMRPPTTTGVLRLHTAMSGESL